MTVLMMSNHIITVAVLIPFSASANRDSVKIRYYGRESFRCLRCEVSPVQIVPNIFSRPVPNSVNFPSTRLEQAVYHYENLLLKAGNLLESPAIDVEGRREPDNEGNHGDSFYSIPHTYEAL